MTQTVKIWFDPEADFMEVLFSDAPGYMRETDNEAIMERVDQNGNLLGFSVLNNFSDAFPHLGTGGGQGAAGSSRHSPGSRCTA
ncbi:DUF2283 domain-containing protein [Nodosilinea sp. P-1105]|uniref:DUF2283 domain-containing protein n=1 Tax=Nodosilinea sp. P-1105 TaxID=2546229 RepID=UPI00146C7C20|nr:DUF2283 domain-containing protein [Nodosilinea sp. P-1105]NMF84698.1 DUF2283 domain-containing protein [Nodosilinea sp. P-1105]